MEQPVLPANEDRRTSGGRPRRAATCSKASAEIVAAAIRTIFAQLVADHVRSQLDEVARPLESQFPNDSDGITYMTPVRSGIMTEGLVYRLGGDEVVQIFYRPPDRGALTSDELSHGFTHDPADNQSGGAPTDCSPWLIIGPNYVVQVGSDSAAQRVRIALPPAD